MGKKKPTITEAFKQMREEFGDCFADIKDVDAFCHEVRYGEPAPAPMPREVKNAVEAASDYVRGARMHPMKNTLRVLLRSLTALTRHLAEVEAERDELLKREDLLERTIDDKWRTRKYIVCRDYQLADMMAMCITALNQRDESESRVVELEACLALCRQCKGLIPCKHCPNDTALAAVGGKG